MKPPASFESVCSIENLSLAWLKVSRGKGGKPSIHAFYQNLDAELRSIAADLKSGSYRPGPYRRFVIKDPKERVISAAQVRDRVVQHAVMNYYDAVFDRNLIHDTYACRVGKGTHKAVLRAFHFAKAYAPPSSGYFLKMDVRKYFDSIDHAVLKSLLPKIIADDKILALFNCIIDSNAAPAPIGLPIGNLTSQYFANFFLSGFDHALKEQRHVKKYLRYMDDMLIFSPDKEELKALYQYAVSYFENNLRLVLKPAIIDHASRGAPFLGFLVKPAGIYLQRKTKIRYKKRVAEFTRKLSRGRFSELEAGSRIESATAHLLLARSRAFRNNVLRGRVLWV